MSDLQEILRELLPIPYPDYNMGRLPDEEDLAMGLQRKANEWTASRVQQAQYSIYEMGLRVLETDEQRKAWHIACYGIDLTRKDDL